MNKLELTLKKCILKSNFKNSNLENFIYNFYYNYRKYHSSWGMEFNEYYSKKFKYLYSKDIYYDYNFTKHQINFIFCTFIIYGENGNTNLILKIDLEKFDEYLKSKNKGCAYNFKDLKEHLSRIFVSNGLKISIDDFEIELSFDYNFKLEEIKSYKNVLNDDDVMSSYSYICFKDAQVSLNAQNIYYETGNDYLQFDIKFKNSKIINSLTTVNLSEIGYTLSNFSLFKLYTDLNNEKKVLNTDCMLTSTNIIEINKLNISGFNSMEKMFELLFKSLLSALEKMLCPSAVLKPASLNTFQNSNLIGQL